MSTEGPSKLDLLDESALRDGALMPILKTSWWEAAANEFDSPLRALPSNASVALLFGADADGFAASYFAINILETIRPREVRTRGVWTTDYDFNWLTEEVRSHRPDLVLCFDIPIMRETPIVKAVAEETELSIYDHHVAGPAERSKLSHVTYLNSRVLDPDGANHPASAFAAAFAAWKLGSVKGSDLLVLATGLIGDRADRRHPELMRYLGTAMPSVMNDGRHPTRLDRFTSGVNALFRSRVGNAPGDAQDTLRELLDRHPPETAIAEFSERYGLQAAMEGVTRDVQRALDSLSDLSEPGVLCQVVPMETFSVGIVASVLADRGVAPVVSIGFRSGDRVEFELRTAQGSGTDLTQLLTRQGRWFQPLSSGGHPNAAGALIRASDVPTFTETLERAWAELDEPNEPASST